jgi:hypothetical protein
MNKDKIKVLYVAGATRSGSTLLARLLGEVKGFVNVGEAARWLYNTDRMSRATPCSCGSSVFDCPFWSDIASTIEGSAEQAFGNRFIRIRYLPLLASPVKRLPFRNKWADLIASTEYLIKSVGAKGGSRVIVDSSKNPANAYVLSQVPGVNVYVVHLVRDPRGVVGSWSRPKKYLSAFPASTVIWWWLSYNLSAESLRIFAEDYALIKYEAFVSDPKGALESILSMVNEPASDLGFLEEGKARLREQHIIAGNPDKLSTGRISIQQTSWSLPPGKTIFVTMSTLPLLAGYQYPLRNPRRSRRE